MYNIHTSIDILHYIISYYIILYYVFIYIYIYICTHTLYKCQENYIIISKILFFKMASEIRCFVRKYDLFPTSYLMICFGNMIFHLKT